jgi:hypothetical protein
VWGKVTAGKVTVDVYTNYGTPHAKHERQQIAVSDRDAAVAFELKEGRRQEPLKEQQLVQAAAGQMAVGRAILAQQLASINDPLVAQEVARRRGLLRGQNRVAQGAVGFQPVIITLPEGTNFAVTGVISADRRYVRITALPIFSGIGDVTTFTFAGAAQPTTGGAGGVGGVGGGVGGGGGAGVGGGGGVGVGGG